MDDYATLARTIVDEVLATEGMRVLGISGGQGAGKTTLTRLIVAECERRSVRVVALSLDDFYLTRAERVRLAREVHPLLITRGVPGTHDLAALIVALDRAGRPGVVEVPRFDKGKDDRDPVPRTLEGGCRIVVVEGWCIGARPESPAALIAPINDLERSEDADGRWRRWVNDRLSGYRALTDRIDYLVYLDVGGLERVFDFRSQQERDLPPDARMAPAAMARFIAHYERLTRWMRADLPARADLTVAVLDDHKVGAVAPRRRSSSVQPTAPKVPPDC